MTLQIRGYLFTHLTISIPGYPWSTRGRDSESKVNDLYMYLRQAETTRNARDYATFEKTSHTVDINSSLREHLQTKGNLYNAKNHQPH